MTEEYPNEQERKFLLEEHENQQKQEKQERADRLESRRLAYSDVSDVYEWDLKHQEDSNPEQLIEYCLDMWESVDEPIPDPDAYREAFLEDWRAMNPGGQVFVIIPLTRRGRYEHSCGVRAGKYTRNEFVDMLRRHKESPDAIQFLADMLEV